MELEITKTPSTDDEFKMSALQEKGIANLMEQQKKRLNSEITVKVKKYVNQHFSVAKTDVSYCHSCGNPIVKGELVEREVAGFPIAFQGKRVYKSYFKYHHAKCHIEKEKEALKYQKTKISEMKQNIKTRADISDYTKLQKARSKTDKLIEQKKKISWANWNWEATNKLTEYKTVKQYAIIIKNKIGDYKIEHLKNKNEFDLRLKELSELFPDAVKDGLFQPYEYVGLKTQPKKIGNAQIVKMLLKEGEPKRRKRWA